ncbi:hypothetical protein HBI50_116760 [Parastagonospora nodorum]|nr:hypothetical protein HBI50_116760 [Parastagonospora nodorum]
MCAKDNLVRRKSLLRLAGELATAESVTAKDSNYVDTFSLDFAFSFAIIILIRLLIVRGNNILLLIAFIISYRLFADELNIQQSLLDRAIVMLIIISVDKTQLLLILGDRSTPSTLLAGFIPITKIRDLFLKTLENAAKSGILLACADGRIRQCYLTICAILADYEEQVLLTSVKKNCYCTRSTDILHLLLKGLVMKMLDFMQDILKRFNNKRAFTELMAVVFLLFVSKAPFALHFIRAVCDLVILAMNVFKEEFRVYRRTLGEEKNFNYSKYICTGANSEAHYITIVKQFYSMTNKKETALLAADYATVVKQSRPSTTLILGIQPYSTKLPLSEVAANIAISDFIYAAAIYPSIKCWQSSGKRHNDSEHCNEEVLYLILIIIDYTCYDKDRKHIAYIRAFSKVLLFNNNRQIDNTTGMLSVRRRAWNAAPKRWTLQAFKFYDLSTIIRLVHLILRDLPNLITRTTMSYYVNNYID